MTTNEKEREQRKASNMNYEINDYRKSQLHDQPTIAHNNKGSVAGRFFHEGKYVRSTCSWIFHKGKDEPAEPNNNRTSHSQNLRGRIREQHLLVQEKQATQNK